MAKKRAKKKAKKKTAKKTTRKVAKKAKKKVAKKAKKKVAKKAKKKAKKKVAKKGKKKAKKAKEKAKAATVTGRWSPAEVRKLRKDYPNMSTRKVAEALGRTTKAVEIKAFKMGLHKKKKYLREVARRLRGVYA